MEQQTNSIPMQAVGADQLPQESGLAYEEVTQIIGSLYLDSHHRVSLMEDQFSAMRKEYERMHAQADAKIKALEQENTALRNELETSRGQTTLPDNDRDN